MKKLIGTVFFNLFFLPLLIGQKYLYSKNLIHFKRSKEKFELVNFGNEFVHLWKTGNDKASLFVFDKQLKLQHSATFHKRSQETLAFVKFSGFYYAFFSEKNEMRVLKVDENGICTDMTDTLKRSLNNNTTKFFLAERAEKHIYLIQALGSDGQSTIYNLATVDSNLRTVHFRSIFFENEYKKKSVVNFTPFDDSIIYFTRHLHGYRQPSTLTLGRVNIKSEEVYVKDFFSKDTNYLFATIFKDGKGNIVLENRLGFIQPQPGQTIYNPQLIKLNKNFTITGSTCFDKFQENDSLKVYSGFLPIKLLSSDESGYLSISYGITDSYENELLRPGGELVVSNSRHNKPDYIRFIWLDSSLAVKKKLYQKTKTGEYYPAFQFLSEKKQIFLYNNKIDGRRANMQGYELIDFSVESKFELNVNPLFEYFLSHAIQINSHSFVVPLLNKNELGLIKISINTSY